MAELDVNEGIVPLIEMRFPEKGTLLTPIYPAPTNARTFVILRLLGVLAGVVAKAVDGRMPADQETIRYTGVYGKDRDGNDYLMREVLGGGSGGRYYADGEDTIHVVPDSRNLPTEFTESRFPFLVERLGLAVDSGGAGRHRGGLGYEKHLRMLEDAHFMSIADRSILACWGVKGGRAGRSFEVTVDLGGPDERVVDALADAEPVRAGQVIRIRTTGGGGWGDPLDRPVDEVERDLRWGKVSFEGARRDYGVVASGTATRRSSTAARHRRAARAAAWCAARPSSPSSTGARGMPPSPTGARQPRSTGSDPGAAPLDRSVCRRAGSEARPSGTPGISPAAYRRSAERRHRVPDQVDGLLREPLTRSRVDLTPLGVDATAGREPARAGAVGLTGDLDPEEGVGERVAGGRRRPHAEAAPGRVAPDLRVAGVDARGRGPGSLPVAARVDDEVGEVVRTGRRVGGAWSRSRHTRRRSGPTSRSRPGSPGSTGWRSS